MKNSLTLHHFFSCFLICIILYSRGTAATVPIPPVNPLLSCVKLQCYTLTCGAGTVSAIGNIKTNDISPKPWSIEVSKPIRLRSGLVGWLREPATDYNQKDKIFVSTKRVNGLTGIYYVKVYSSACSIFFDHDASVDCVDSSQRKLAPLPLKSSQCQ